MNIAQALKEKNKKIAKLQGLWDRFYRYNVVTEGEPKPYSSSELWKQIDLLIEELVDLKTRIHSASEPVRSKIFMLSELKNKAQRLKSLNTNGGTVRDRYSETVITQVAELGVLWKDQNLEAIEAAIEHVQEELDKFNHTTQI